MFTKNSPEIMIIGPTNANNKTPSYIYDSLLGISNQLGKRVFCAQKFSKSHKDSKFTPPEVYALCKEKVLNSKLILAYVGHPSLGTGQELEIAANNKIPIILFYEKNTPVSKMVLGNPSIIKKIIFTNYEEAVIKLQTEIKEYFKR